MSKKNCTNIGGQAVLEGVMMRGKSSIATAVRESNGNIQLESDRFKPNSEKSVWFRIPIIRGVLNFVGSMITGVKTLTRASEVYGDLSDEEPTKAEKWLAKKLKLDIMDIVIFLGVTLGICFSIALFILLPQFLTSGFIKIFKLSALGTIPKNLIAGAIRISIFVGYILLIGQMKDIKRLFRYHGAEHKVISCYESGLEMNVANAQTMSTVHDRCGTTFMFLIMLVSIIFFSFFKWQTVWLNILIRLIFIPFVAGFSYELLKLLAKYDNIFTRILKFPGLLLQKLTTKEPDDSMVEVALLAFNTVLALESDAEMPTSKFVTFCVVEKAKQEILNDLKTENKDIDAELILMEVLGAKNRTELYDGRKASSTDIDRAKQIVKKANSGMPIQYAMGAANFYGYDFDVNNNVLIPRMDTEILAEASINAIKTKSNAKVLELCTGSGAVAITIALNTDAVVFATDISQDALNTAKNNATKHQVNINFLEGDMFDCLADNKFDVIIANPPYIPSADIDSLDSVVKGYEPRLALDGGEDGLDFYRTIANNIDNYLLPDGILLIEIGINQVQSVCNLFTKYDIIVSNDYNTPPIPRVLQCRKKVTE